MGKLLLGYWNIHGLASQIRFLLELAGADYEEKYYDEPDKWFKEDKENLGLLFPNLPYIIDKTDDGETIKMTEHLPIVKYLARKHGLYPQTEPERVVAEQTESFLLDIRNNFYKVAYGTKENFEKGKSEFLEGARKKLPYLERLLTGRDYVTGKLSYIDVILYDFSLLFSVFAPELLDEHQNIKRHFKTIDNIPQIKNYRNGKGKLPWKVMTFCWTAEAVYDGKI